MTLQLNRISPIESLKRVISNATHALVLNTSSRQYRRGRPVIVKRRNGSSEKIAKLANRYFQWAQVPIRFWSNARGWQQWEVRCYQMLNDGFKISAQGEHTICQDAVPG